MIDLTVVRLTLRGLFGRRRFLFLLPLPALVAGLALLARAFENDPTEWGEPVVVGLGFAVVLPVLALIVGASALGSEIEDGTVVHVLAKPLPRRTIIISKLLVAVVVTAVVAGAGLAAAGWVAGPPRLALGLLAGAAAGALGYGAVFLALSVLTRRPVLVGLVYVLVWEATLGNVLDGVRVLSIQQYAVSIAARTADVPWLNPTLGLPLALTLTAVVTVAATALAIDRLRSFTLTGDTS